MIYFFVSCGTDWLRLLFFVLAMPPITHTVLNRSDPWVFGLPFFYVALLAVYSALILVLIWAFRRGV